MLKENYIDKKSVRYCTEAFTLGEALQLLNETGFRCSAGVRQQRDQIFGNYFENRHL